MSRTFKYKLIIAALAGWSIGTTIILLLIFWAEGWL